MTNPTIFTTSWDDGHPLDLRVGEILSQHGFQGTFYVPISNREGLPVLQSGEIQRLGETFEIGSHTIDHRYLRTVGAADARRQIAGGKEQLEQILGHGVSGFCYPGGHYAAQDRQMVIDAGFAYARTGANFYGAVPPDRFSVPTTIQFYPHTRDALIRNFLSHGDWGRRANLCRVALWRGDLMARLQAVLDHVCAYGGVFHLWGHSWELEAFDGWRQLERFLAHAAERVPQGGRLTNRQTVQTAAAAAGAPSDFASRPL